MHKKIADFHILTQAIVDEAIMGILAFELPKQTLVFANRMAEELLEIAPMQITNYTLSSLFAEDLSNKEHKGFSSEFVGLEGLFPDILVRKFNGQVFVASLGVKKVSLESGEFLILMLQDVTLRKKLQRELTLKQNEIRTAYEELLKQNQQLKELDVAKDRFIALTAHELRTPLSAMVASAEVLKLGLYDNEEQLKEFISIISEQGLRLQELIDDILDFAKIQAGKMDFYLEQSDRFSILSELAVHFQSFAEPRRIRLYLVQPVTPLTCYFDSLRLRQVLSNIIGNAVKYNVEDGEVTIWGEIKPGIVKILVRDTGPGIPENQAHAVFNEFETIGNVVQHHKGTGLGMPISKKLMEGMGGKIQFESEVGIGTTFWIELPTTKVLSNDLYRPRPSGIGDLAS